MSRAEWRIMPVEATKEMVEAGEAGFNRYGGIKGAYRAMVEAASRPAGGGVDGWTPPEACDGREQLAFEAWARGRHYDMSEHPLHYIFMDPKTDAARMGWNAALQYVRDLFAETLPPPLPANAGRVEWAASIRGTGLDPVYKKTLHVLFDHPVTDKDRSNLIAAINAFTEQERAALSSPASSSPADSGAMEEPGTPCERCQGNGEIVTDWDRYLHGEPDDKGDEGTADCPDCDGTGRITASSSPAEAEALPAGVEAVREAFETWGKAYYIFLDPDKKRGRTYLTERTETLWLAFQAGAALSSAPAQEEGSKDLGAHPRGSGQSAGEVEKLREALTACHSYLCDQTPNNETLLDVIDAALARGSSQNASSVEALVAKVHELGLSALPVDIQLRMEREARNHSNLWANGDRPVYHAALALQLRTHLAALEGR